jgi:hypothetical protein
MSCRPNYDPCLDSKLNQIGSYASVARQSAQSATASAAAADADATAAAASAAAAAASAEIAGIYLGAFATPPTVDNQGGSLQEGMLYYNTVSNTLFVWNGSSWSAIQDDDIYLGGFAVAPVLNNQGLPLVSGNLYWNNVTNNLWAYNGVAWAVVNFNEFTPFLATGTTFARNLTTRAADIVNVKDFSAVGDGIVNDTAAIQLALNTSATAIYFPKGTYRIANDGITSTPAINSSVANRRIFGEGVITATTQVKRALGISGNNTTVSLNIDGNLNIGTAIYVTAENPVITGCRISNLDGKTTWQGVGIQLDFDGLDTTAIVSNNVIKNLQGVGDGILGNGIGMQRAITINSDQNCSNKIIVTGNNIEKIEGQEGDAIVVISSNGAGTYYDLPVTISNNNINLWTRRGIKVQANYVTINNNIISNTDTLFPPTLQGAIDIVQGSNATVVGNTLLECKGSPQIVAYRTGAESQATGLVVSNNVIKGIGAETINTIIAVASNAGENVVVSGNSIIAPDFVNTAILITDTINPLICNNLIITGNNTWYNLSSLTDARIFGNIYAGETNYHQYIEDGGSHVFDVTLGKEILIKNRDTTVSNGEIVASITAQTNDTSAPNEKMASIKFVAEGSTGGAGIRFATGNSGSSNVEKLHITNGGNVLMLTNGASFNLKDSSGVNYALTANTSGSLLLNGTVVSLSGTYTPTLFNTLNVSSSTAFVTQWMQVGNVVTVAGAVTIETTAAGNTELGFALPLPSSFTGFSQCGGSAMPAAYLTTAYFSINGDIANNRAQFRASASAAGTTVYTFTFTYRII